MASTRFQEKQASLLSDSTALTGLSQTGIGVQHFPNTHSHLYWLSILQDPPRSGLL